MSEPTLGELFAVYIEDHAKVHCSTWPNMLRCFNSYLIDWRDRPASSITRLEVRRLHGQLGSKVGKTTANRVIQQLRAMYNMGRDWQILDCPNPAVGVHMFRLQPRERFLDQDEIERLLAAITTLRYETTRDFLTMCLFTAARRSNVAAMRWDEIDFNLKIWRMPKSKNGESQTVPLTQDAITLLTVRRLKSKSEWVFDSLRSRTGHLMKPEEAWKAVKSRARLSNARIHDLRRTLASWQAITGANLLVIAQTLNHKDLKSTAIYARLQIDPVRAAMTAATDVMLKRKKNPIYKEPLD